MTSKTRTLITSAALGALLLSTAAVAGPRFSSTQTTTREAGHVSRDASVTRNRDGATASSHYDRTRSQGSVTRSVEQTGFEGRTRSGQTTRTRTETGSVLTGTATGRGGNSYTIAGETVRSENGRTSSRAVTGESGAVVASRDAAVVRADGSVTRTVTTTGPRRN